MNGRRVKALRREFIKRYGRAPLSTQYLVSQPTESQLKDRVEAAKKAGVGVERFGRIIADDKHHFVHSEWRGLKRMLKKAKAIRTV